MTVSGSVVLRCMISLTLTRSLQSAWAQFTETVTAVCLIAACCLSDVHLILIMRVATPQDSQLLEILFVFSYIATSCVTDMTAIRHDLPPEAKFGSLLRKTLFVQLLPCSLGGARCTSRLPIFSLIVARAVSGEASTLQITKEGHRLTRDGSVLASTWRLLY